MHEREMHLNLVWNTLMFFAHPDSYILGERTGGVLQGCPRSDPPSPEEMAGYARRALAELREYVGVEPEEWMFQGAYAPTATAEQVRADVRRARGQMQALYADGVPDFMNRIFQVALNAQVPGSPGGAHASDEALDAELGRVAMRFVDRAGDVCEQDPAERICEEFHQAMAAVIERRFPTMRGPAQGGSGTGAQSCQAEGQGGQNAA